MGQPHYILRLTRPTIFIHTTTVGFVVWWIIILLLHAVNAVYYCGAATLYRYMLGSHVAFQVTTYSIGIRRNAFQNPIPLHCSFQISQWTITSWTCHDSVPQTNAQFCHKCNEFMDPPRQSSRTMANGNEPFETSKFQSVPPTLLKMKMMLLSFANSRIATVPIEIIEDPFLKSLLVSNTLVQELPRVIQRPSPVLSLLFLPGTNISTFWSWTHRHTGKITAYGTRYCTQREQIAAGTRTSFGISTIEPTAHDLASVMDVFTPAKLALAVSIVTCKPSFSLYYPLSLQDTKTALH